MSATQYPSPNPTQWLFRRGAYNPDDNIVTAPHLQAAIVAARANNFEIPEINSLLKLNKLITKLEPYFGGSGIKQCYILTDSNTDFNRINIANPSQVATETGTIVNNNKTGNEKSSTALLDLNFVDSDIYEGAEQKMWYCTIVSDIGTDEQRILGTYNTPNFFGIHAIAGEYVQVRAGENIPLTLSKVAINNKPLLVYRESGAGVVRRYLNSELISDVSGLTFGTTSESSWNLGAVGGRANIGNEANIKFLILGSDEQTGIAVSKIMQDFYNETHEIIDWSGRRDGVEVGRCYSSKSSTSRYVSIPLSETHKTITFWFKYSTTTRAYLIGGDFITLDLDGTFFKISPPRAGETYYDDITMFNDGVWHFFWIDVRVSDSNIGVSQEDIYIDGNLIATTSARAYSVLRLGARGTGASGYNGELFDVRFFAERLSQSEIEIIKNTFQNPVGKTLLRWYRIDEIAGSKNAIDYSGNNQHGTYISTDKFDFYEGTDVPYSFANEEGFTHENIVLDVASGGTISQISENEYEFQITNVNSGTYTSGGITTSNKVIGGIYDVQFTVYLDATNENNDGVLVGQFLNGKVEKVSATQRDVYGSFLLTDFNYGMFLRIDYQAVSLTTPIKGRVVVKRYEKRNTNEPPTKVRYNAQYIDVNPSGPYWLDAEGTINNNPYNAPGIPTIDVDEDTTWLDTTAYNIGELVVYNGREYQALTSNLDKQPDTNPTDWQDNGLAQLPSHIFSLSDVINTDAHFIDNQTTGVGKNFMLYRDVLTGRLLGRNKKMVRL